MRELTTWAYRWAVLPPDPRCDGGRPISCHPSLELSCPVPELRSLPRRRIVETTFFAASTPSNPQPHAPLYSQQWAPRRMPARLLQPPPRQRLPALPPRHQQSPVRPRGAPRTGTSSLRISTTTTSRRHRSARS